MLLVTLVMNDCYMVLSVMISYDWLDVSSNDLE